MTPTTICKLPTFAQHLWEDRRYTTLYGGRGSSKSWTVARALLLQASEEPHRVLCGREVQRSIKDSVHRLLSDTIPALGLESFYRVLDTEIRGANGSLFVFSGLSSHTVDSIKSYEGITRLWIEEGQSLSKRSIDIITPTIRAPGSRIWVTMNPFLESDPASQRFLINPDPDMLAIRCNYTDNPFFPVELDRERRNHLVRDPDTYGHVWLGEHLPAVEGAIFFREIADMEHAGRIRPLAVDPLLSCHTIWDIGVADNTVVLIVQAFGRSLYLLDAIIDNNRSVSSYCEELIAWKEAHPEARWGDYYMPHDAWHRDFTVGTSAADVVARMLKRQPERIPMATVEAGIKVAREVIPRLFINDTLKRAHRPGKAPLIDSLKRYAWDVPKLDDKDARRPKHDQHSHVGDAIRYLSLVADDLRNDDHWGTDIDYSNADAGVI